jgi:hypothetical protein
MSVDPETLVHNYVEMWNEFDAEKRHAAVRAVWVEDGENFTSTSEYRGYQELYERADVAHNNWVAEKNYRFRSTGTIKSHHGYVLFTWEMFALDDGTVIPRGTDVFVVADDGRAKTVLSFVRS